jgi:hypothetical protein
MLSNKYIFIIFLFFMVKNVSGQFFLSSYFFAYGNDEINVYWDYHCENQEDLLGCNILRYESDPLQTIMLNQGLITSLDKNFYYLDTTNIFDTAIYFYRVEFIFESDTLPFNYHTGSFKSIEFNTVGPAMIEMVAVPKNQGYFYVDVYWDNILATVLSEEDTFALEMDPYDLEIYTNYIGFWGWDFAGNDNGTILTSIFHLKELLLTQTSDYSLPEISISNYPNPFTESTLINLDIGIGDYYQISIFNSQGVLVRTLEGGFLDVGNFYVIWDRRNDIGIKVPSGLYYCIINSSRRKKTLKLNVQ